MIIRKLTDTNGHALKNAEVCQRMLNALRDLRDGVGKATEEEREEARLQFVKICGNSEANAAAVVAWLEQLEQAPSPAEKQRLIERSLLPTRNK